MSTHKFFVIGGALVALMVLPFLGGCASQRPCATVPNWNWSSNRQNWTYAPGAKFTNVTNVTPQAPAPQPEQQWPSGPTNWGGNFNFNPQCMPQQACPQPYQPQYMPAPCPQPYQPPCQPVCPPQYVPTPPMPILPIPPSYNYNCPG